MGFKENTEKEIKMETMCIQCRKKQIYIRKHGLCKSCYAKYRNTKDYIAVRDRKYTSKQTENKIKHDSEMSFIKKFFNHKNWLYQPAIFRLNGMTYQPDFYDVERNVFIEVSATKQAFYYNKHKYNEFIKTYPKINFEVRTDEGVLIPLYENIEGMYPK